MYAHLPRQNTMAISKRRRKTPKKKKRTVEKKSQAPTKSSLHENRAVDQKKKMSPKTHTCTKKRPAGINQATHTSKPKLNHREFNRSQSHNNNALKQSMPGQEKRSNSSQKIYKQIQIKSSHKSKPHHFCYSSLVKY